MYRIILENAKGEQLELTNNPAYSIMSVDGLYPPSATINTSTMANMDGSQFNSSCVNERNIVIEFAIESPAEENRINLYKYIKTKQYIKFYYKNETRDVYIEGRVESMPIEFFEKKQKAQLSILCPSPFFKNVDSTVIELYSVVSNFEFPFSIAEEGIPFSELKLGVEKSIINGGDIEDGVIIELVATGTVLNPKIYNSGTREHFFLNMEMQAGDKVTINTRKGEKSVMLLRDGVESNIIAKHAIGSSWFQLQPGDNTFIYNADERAENLSCIFIQNNLFEGV